MDNQAEFWSEYKRFLHANLVTESPNPLSYNLSELCQTNLQEAFTIFKTIELNAVDSMISYAPLIEKLRSDISSCLTSGRKIFLIGCGASGRLAMLLKRIYEFEHINTPKQIISVSAGGDTTLIKAIEKFEDRKQYGVKQLLEQGYTDKDLVIGLSAGGESPFILGSVEFANQTSIYKPWLIFNNPINSLLKRNPEHIVQNINAMCLDVGPMALTGSTRLQATTAMQIAVALAFTNKNIADEIKQISSIIKAFPLENLAKITKKEADIIKNHEFVLYTTDTPLLGLSLLADITERSPTFNIIPFENSTEVDNKNYSPFYLKLNNVNSPNEVWQMLFGQDPTCLKWADFEATATDYINGFDLSKNSPRTNGAYLPKKQHLLSLKPHEGFIDIMLDDEKLSFELPNDILHKTIIYKLILNSHSTLMMGRLGYFSGNMMLSLKPSNFKLIDRAIRYSQFIINKNLPLTYHEVAKIVFAEIDKLQPGQSIVKQVVDQAYYIHKLVQ